MRMKPLVLAVTLLAAATNCTRFSSAPPSPSPKTPGEVVPKDIADYLSQMQAQRAQNKPNEIDTSVLPNGLRLVVISDPAATQASIAVRVGSGLYSDPAGYRGMAHYLEHSVFLGSAKYPIPDEFSKFVEEHQGNYNAFTRPYDTNYIATVPNENYPEAVDRMADFLIAPIFDSKYVEKELAAIQGEYDKNVAIPERQRLFLMEEFYKKGTPTRHLFQGNRTTLGNVPTPVMKEFFEKNYSSKNMIVVMIGSQKVSELKALGEKYFAGVPVRNFIPVNISPRDSQRESPPQFVKAKVGTKKYMLSLRYSLPPRGTSYWQTKDYDVLEVALDDEREGTLIDYLKTKGWITKLESGAETYDPTGGTYEIDLMMTPEGYKHWSEIASGTLAYLEQAKAAGLRDAMAANAKRMGEINYLLETKSPFERVADFARAEAAYGPDQTYERQQLIPKSDKAVFARAIAQLSQNSLDVVLQAPDLEGDRKSEFYNFTYSAANLADQPWARTATALPGLAYNAPETNPFLPATLAPNKGRDKKQVQIAKSSLVTTTLMRDDTFKEPLAHIAVEFQSGPELIPSAEGKVLGSLLSLYVPEALSRWASPATAVGYKAEMAPIQA